MLIDFVGRDGNIAKMSVVDVGAGTGRASLLLARAGADVTAVDASREMLAIAERRAAEESEATAPARPIHFVVGTLTRSSLPDQSFDAAVSLRVLMHTPEWRRCLGELCRVARRAVVIDYPSARSVAAIESFLRKGAHALGVKTEAYRVFGAGTLAKELEAHGFRVRQSIVSSSCRLLSTRPWVACVYACDRGRSRARGAVATLRISDYGRRRTVRVLVTGATGFTGHHLATSFARRGYRSVRSCAPPIGLSTLAESGIELVTGDLTDSESVARALDDKRGRVDVVYNIAALYRQASLPSDVYRAVNATAVLN